MTHKETLSWLKQNQISWKLYKSTKRLQVLFDETDINCEWQYVFCHNPVCGIITTKDPKKALKERDLEYFKNKFGNYHFRVVKP